MRYKLTLFLTSLSFTVFAQTQKDIIARQMDYLEAAKTNLSYVQESSETGYVKLSADSMIQKMDLMLSYLQSLQVVEDVNETIADMEEDASDTEIYIDETIEQDTNEFPPYIENPDEEEAGLSNPVLDKFNPFKKMKTNFILETGLNNYYMSLSTSGSEPTVNTGRSWFWNFGLVKIIPVTKKLNISAGITYLRNRFRFSNDVRLIAEGNPGAPDFIAVDNTVSDPKVITSYFTLPVSFTYKLNKTFHITLGGFGGYHLGTIQKLNLKVGEEEIREYRNGAYGVNKWIYGVKAGLGLGGFDLFCQLNLANYFETNKKYDYKLYMIGTSLKF